MLRIIGKTPVYFSGKGGGDFGQAHFGNAKINQNVKISSDGKWKQGDRVFHDDQGYGAVVNVFESEDGPVIKVRFDNGQEKRFLSLYQSGNFTKMGNDD